jgi:hypothetical protein
MNESIPSSTHPPQAAQKLRTWFAVSGTRVGAKGIISPDAGSISVPASRSCQRHIRKVKQNRSSNPHDTRSHKVSQSAWNRSHLCLQRVTAGGRHVLELHTPVFAEPDCGQDSGRNNSESARSGADEPPQLAWKLSRRSAEPVAIRRPAAHGGMGPISHAWHRKSLHLLQIKKGPEVSPAPWLTFKPTSSASSPTAWRERRRSRAAGSSGRCRS